MTMTLESKMEKGVGILKETSGWPYEERFKGDKYVDFDAKPAKTSGKRIKNVGCRRQEDFLSARGR